MPVRAALPLLAALLVSLPASAQIEITSASLYPSYPFTSGAAVTSDVFTTDGVAAPAANQALIDAMISRTGARQVWDFSAVAFARRSQRESTFYTTLTGLPGADSFPSATVAHRERPVRSPEAFCPPRNPCYPHPWVYTYGTLTSTAFTALGHYTEPTSGAPGYVDTYGSAGLVRYPFPFTWGSAVSDRVQVTSTYPVSPPYSYSIEESRTVVGYGTLITPAGSAPCLMVREVFRRDPGSGTQLVFRWVTETNLSASATHLTGLADYTVHRPTTPVATEGAAGTARFTLSAGPTPARGSVTLRVATTEPSDATVGVWDALGRRVAVVHVGPLGAGEHSFRLDTSRLAPGVYVARAEAGTALATTRLVVVR